MNDEEFNFWEKIGKDMTDEEQARAIQYCQNNPEKFKESLASLPSDKFIDFMLWMGMVNVKEGNWTDAQYRELVRDMGDLAKKHGL